MTRSGTLGTTRLGTAPKFADLPGIDTFQYVIRQGETRTTMVIQILLSCVCPFADLAHEALCLRVGVEMAAVVGGRDEKTTYFTRALSGDFLFHIVVIFICGVRSRWKTTIG